MTAIVKHKFYMGVPYAGDLIARGIAWRTGNFTGVLMPWVEIEDGYTLLAQIRATRE